MKNESGRYHNTAPTPAVRRLLKASLYVAAVAIVIISLLIGCTTHPSHIYADRVFVDCGHTYRAYRNDRAAIITHDGGCEHPMHRCRDTVYNYGVTE